MNSVNSTARPSRRARKSDPGLSTANGAEQDESSATQLSVAGNVLNADLRALIDRMPLWRRPGYLVRRLHQIHTSLFLEECGAFDITPVQYALLTTLSLKPDSDQNSLAQEIGLDRTNVADVLRRLAKQGLLTRKRSTRDQRMVIARLTARGELLTASMHDAMIRAQQRLVEVLDPTERERFLTTLLKLVDANNGHGRSTLGPAQPRGE
jgi:DNA-binding MarR family transcriptional regulator